MSPSSVAAGSTSPALPVKYSKKSADSSHDVRPPAKAQAEVTPSKIGQVGRSKTLPLSSRGQSIQDAVQPQLSERDSIFAEHYMPTDDPVTSPSVLRQRDSEVNGSIAGRDGAMAVSPARSLTELSSLFHGDVSGTTITISHPQKQFQKSPSRSRPDRSSLTFQRQRRSLYEPHDFRTLSSGSLHDSHHEESSLPPSASTLYERPSTLHSQERSKDYAQELERSTERQQYRSWRQGKAKMNGLSIAASQRKRSRDEDAVDKTIDAQLPKAEPAINIRSRKASHYLGLFKENDADQRRRDELSRTKQARLDREEPSTGKLQEDDTSKKLHRALAVRDQPSVKSDVESVEDSNEVTVSATRMAHTIPISLLEEIRNHHNLSPSTAKAIPERLQKEAGLTAGERKPSKVPEEDEDSDREHISSALYFPHRGPALGDSPTDDVPGPQKEAKKTSINDHPDEVALLKSKETSPTLQHDDVQIALRSDGDLECLHGDLARTRAPSESKVGDNLAPPAEKPGRSSDSDYESDYSLAGSESNVSEEEHATPTATPKARAPISETRQHRSTHRHVHQPPAPIGAVELKPYDHQVGGHSTVYRFSRRALCKKLNSRENEFYETIEKRHPELLGFLPRYATFPLPPSLHTAESQQRCSGTSAFHASQVIYMLTCYLFVV